MSWTWSSDPAAFLAAVGHVLEADPVTHTNAVSQAHLRPEQARFGVWDAAGSSSRPGGAIVSPPYPLLLVDVPEASIRPLAQGWPVEATAVMGSPGLAAQVAAVWCAVHGGQAVLRHAERLHRLAGLIEPPAVPGAARAADDGDIAVVAGEVAAFAAEAGVPAPDAEWLTTRLTRGGAVLWEVDGELVALASVSAPALRQVRIGPVWTPPEHRSHGYGAAVTAAATRWGLERADEVLLHTDLANPTSNALYRRLGYVELEDLLVLDLLRPGGARGGA